MLVERSQLWSIVIIGLVLSPRRSRGQNESVVVSQAAQERAGCRRRRDELSVNTSQQAALGKQLRTGRAQVREGGQVVEIHNDFAQMNRARPGERNRLSYLLVTSQSQCRQKNWRQTPYIRGQKVNAATDD